MSKFYLKIRNCSVTHTFYSRYNILPILIFRSWGCSKVLCGVSVLGVTFICWGWCWSLAHYIFMIVVLRLPGKRRWTFGPHCSWSVPLPPTLSCLPRSSPVRNRDNPMEKSVGGKQDVSFWRILFLPPFIPQSLGGVGGLPSFLLRIDSKYSGCREKSLQT